MTLKTFIKGLFIEEAVPKPTSKIVNSWNYNGDQPDVSFKQLIEYHDRTPQISVGVAGYAKLIDLTNIQINADDDKAKKFIEDWNEQVNIKDKLESLVNTLLICGNAILEKLDDKNIQDVAEVDISTITDKKRDEYGNTLCYFQNVNGQRVTLGETNLNKFIEFNLAMYSKKSWSPCLFHSLALPRTVRNRTMMPLIEVLWGIEDAMSAIILNNAYPITYVTFEGANEDELSKEAEKIRKRKPGDTHIVTKKPQLDMYETSPQSKYTDYIQHIEKVIQLGIKFPTDIITGDFTSRASSNTTEDLTLKIARGYQRYIANKLKTELYNPILAQNGFDPKKVNLSVSFSTQNIIQLTPESVLDMADRNKITIDEFREWLGSNTGIDLFDDINTNGDMIPVDDKKGGFVMKPRIVKRERKEESEYQGRKVTLNSPFRTPDGPKKFSVYVKNDKGNVVKVNFGDPNMSIKRDDPERRKSFRARHDCDNAKDITTPRYWSCYQWRAGAKVQEEDDFTTRVVYKLDYDHDKIDKCDDYADEVYEIGSSDMPELPIHPNCKCYYEDEETGEYLGQEPEFAVYGDSPLIPESFKKEMESIHSNLKSIQDVLKTKIKSESAKEQILTEINKIQTKIDSNTEEQDKKRTIIENRQKEILDKIDGEINNV